MLLQGYKSCAWGGGGSSLNGDKEVFSLAALARGDKKPELPRVQLLGGFSPRTGADVHPSLGLCCVRGSPRRAPLPGQAGRDMRSQAQAPACSEARECCSAWKWPFFDFLALPCRCHAGCQLRGAAGGGSLGSLAPTAGLALAVPKCFCLHGSGRWCDLCSRSLTGLS